MDKQSGTSSECSQLARQTKRCEPDSVPESRAEIALQIDSPMCECMCICVCEPVWQLEDYYNKAVPSI